MGSSAWVPAAVFFLGYGLEAAALAGPTLRRKPAARRAALALGLGAAALVGALALGEGGILTSLGGFLFLGVAAVALFSRDGLPVVDWQVLVSQTVSLGLAFAALDGPTRAASLQPVEMIAVLLFVTITATAAKRGWACATRISGYVWFLAATVLAMAWSFDGDLLDAVSGWHGPPRDLLTPLLAGLCVCYFTFALTALLAVLLPSISEDRDERARWLSLIDSVSGRVDAHAIPLLALAALVALELGAALLARRMNVAAGRWVGPLAVLTLPQALFLRLERRLLPELGSAEDASERGRRPARGRLGGEDRVGGV